MRTTNFDPQLAKQLGVDPNDASPLSSEEQSRLAGIKQKLITEVAAIIDRPDDGYTSDIHRQADVTNRSVQLATLWVNLNAMRNQINGQILPAIAYTETYKEAPTLSDALEQLEREIQSFLARYQISAEVRNS